MNSRQKTLLCIVADMAALCILFPFVDGGYRFLFALSHQAVFESFASGYMLFQLTLLMCLGVLLFFRFKTTTRTTQGR